MIHNVAASIVYNPILAATCFLELTAPDPADCDGVAGVPVEKDKVPAVPLAAAVEGLEVVLLVPALFARKFATSTFIALNSCPRPYLPSELGLVQSVPHAV